jgi:uncharacterized protein (TIGR03545 family)
MKWIRWWGLAAFIGLVVVLGGAWYLLAPWLVKSTIEGVGSESVGAQVNVTDVELGLFPAKFKINNLQVTNADAPMTNLVEVGEIALAVDSSELFWKKLIVEEMVISGVKFATPRTHSGALEGGRKTAQMMNAIENFELPNINEIDTNKLIKDSELLTPKRIEQFSRSKLEIEEYWKGALDKEKNAKEIADITAEFDQLKNRAKKNKLNLLKDSNKWKSLKQKIKIQQKKYTDLKQRLQTDKETLSKQLSLIKQGPKDDLNQIMGEVGLGEGGLENISEKYLGPKVTPWVMKALDFAKNYQQAPATKEDEVIQQGLGRRVYFKDEQHLPEILIKNIVINGEQGNWKLGGKGNDIAVPPWQWDKPANLSGEFTGNGDASFQIKSEWKSETEMLTKVNALAKNWSLTQFPLKQDETGLYELTSAVINTDLKGSITLEKVNLSMNLTIGSPKISFPDAVTGWKKQILEGVNLQNSIDINISVSGDLLSPTIKIKSGLEKIFKQVVSARLSKETDKIKQKLQDSLSGKIGDISKFKNLDFSSFQNQLNLEDGQLGDLLGKF